MSVHSMSCVGAMVQAVTSGIRSSRGLRGLKHGMELLSVLDVQSMARPNSMPDGPCNEVQ